MLYFVTDQTAFTVTANKVLIERLTGRPTERRRKRDNRWNRGLAIGGILLALASLLKDFYIEPEGRTEMKIMREEMYRLSSKVQELSRDLDSVKMLK